MKTIKKYSPILIACLVIMGSLSSCKKTVEQKEITIDVIVSSDFESSVLPKELQNLYAPSAIFTDKEQRTMFVPTGKLSRVDLKTPAEITIKAEDDVIAKILRHIKKPNEKDIQRNVKKYLSQVEVANLNSKETTDNNEKINRIKEFIKQRQGENANYAQILFYSDNPKNASWENNKIYHDIDSLRLVLFETVSSNQKSKFVVVYNPPIEPSSKKPDSSDSAQSQNITTTLSVGKTYSLSEFAADKKIVWTNSNPTVATIKDGTVIALSKGSATITATDGGNVVYKITVTITPPPVPQPHTKSYSFGEYVGSLKYSNDLRTNIPEGQGTMYYSKRVQVAKHDTKTHYTENGDIFVGTWGNGDIVNGFLKHKDGSEEAILAGKRFNPYDISKD